MSDVYDIIYGRLDEIERGAEKAHRSAIKRAVVSGRAAAARIIHGQYALKTGTIKKAMRITISSEKTASEIKYSGYHIPLIDYSWNRLSSGEIRVQTKKDGERAVLKHVFYKPSKKYPSGIYERITSQRTPLRQIYGPSIPQIMSSNDEVRDAIEKAQSETYSERYAHNVIAIVNGWWEKQLRSTDTKRYALVAKRASDNGADVKIILEQYLKGADPFGVTQN